MRNLKRALSLGLTAAMISGLMVMGSSAAGYADVTSEQNEEAIEVLQTIGIMIGDEDGNFNPDQNVTRNQMAVIMANLMEYNVAVYKDTSPFTDVPSWAEPYVAACYTNGITSGYSSTIYGGEDTVTTAQAALMLMKALGYFQYASDFGSDWQLATLKQGNNIDLFVGVDTRAEDPLTRNDVAQLVLNTLEAGTVQASTDGSWTIGDVTVTSGVKYDYITSNQPYASAIDDKRTTNNDGDLVSGSIVELGEQLYMGDLKLNDKTSDEFERPSRTWSYDGAEIGTYMKKDLIIATYTEGVTGRELYDLLTSATIKEYGFEAYLNGTTADPDGRDVIVKSDLKRSNNNDLEQTGTGVLTQVFLDLDNKEITVTSMDTWLARANSDYNESAETLSVKVYDENTDGSEGDTQVLDLTDVPEIEGVVADQFLLVNQSMKDRDQLEIVAISEPEILTGAEITKFSTVKDSDKEDSLFTEVTADGTKYEAAEQAHYDEDVLNLYDHDLLTDMSYNVYLDPYGNAIGVDLYEGSLNYVFITGYDRNKSHISVTTADAAAIFLDGTMDVITVNVTNTNKNLDRNDDGDVDADYIEKYDLWTAAGDGESQVNRWFTYTENNGVYTLKPVDADEMLVTDYPDATDKDPKVINCSNVWVQDNVTNAMVTGENLTQSNIRGYGNDDSVYITVEPGDVDYQTLSDEAITDVTGVYTGVQNVDIEMSPDTKLNVPEYMYTLIDDDQYIIASIVLGEAQGSVENYAVILDAPTSEERLSDGTYIWTFDAIMGGEKVELSAKSKYQDVIIDLQTAAKTDAVMELRFDADEYVTGAEAVDADKVATFAIADGMENYEVFDQEIDGNTTTLEMNGRTMQIRDESGLTFVTDAPTVLWQKINNKGTYTAYSSVQDAYNDLADANETDANLQFNGRIVAVLNAQGVAEWAYIRSDTPVNSKDGSFVDDGSATTLPSTTDLLVSVVNGGSIAGAGRYDADAGKLYLKFEGLTAGASKVTLNNVSITDGFGAGRVVNLPLELIKTTDLDGTTSYVYVTNFTATELTGNYIVLGNNITVDLRNATETVDEWFIKYAGDVEYAEGAPETVANDAGTKFTFTVKKPDNTVSYGIKDGNTGAGVNLVTPATLPVSGLIEDVKITLEVRGDKAPVVSLDYDSANTQTLASEGSGGKLIPSTGDTNAQNLVLAWNKANINTTVNGNTITISGWTEDSIKALNNTELTTLRGGSTSPALWSGVQFNAPELADGTVAKLTKYTLDGVNRDLTNNQEADYHETAGILYEWFKVADCTESGGTITVGDVVTTRTTHTIKLVWTFNDGAANEMNIEQTYTVVIGG